MAICLYLSVIVASDDTASDHGWYQAFRVCFYKISLLFVKAPDSVLTSLIKCVASVLSKSFVGRSHS